MFNIARNLLVRRMGNAFMSHAPKPEATLPKIDPNVSNAQTDTKATEAAVATIKKELDEADIASAAKQEQAKTNSPIPIKHFPQFSTPLNTRNHPK